MEYLFIRACNQLHERNIIFQHLELILKTENIFKLYSKKIPKKGIQHINKVPAITSVYGAANMLKAILHNLTGDPIKFVNQAILLKYLYKKLSII